MSAYPFDLILFDLDGTLVETAPEIADAVNDTLSALGHPAVLQQEVDDWIGHGTRELLIQALAKVLGTSTATVRHSEAFPGSKPTSRVTTRRVAAPAAASIRR